MNSAAAMAERRCGRLKCGSDFALTFGGVGHFQRNPGKAFSTRQARRAPAPVGEEGRRWSGRPQRTQDFRQSASANRRGSWTPPLRRAEKRRIGVYGAVRAQQQQLCGFDAPKRPKRFE